MREEQGKQQGKQARPKLQEKEGKGKRKKRVKERQHTQAARAMYSKDRCCEQP